ncbi:type I polyketide synthase, partial [Streptomyces sp. NPDC059818]|uniref:type I polyketide synthase n=1 Tax=Streptomyces sp. NPDC059818 TaxID=3346962 RepID=UPI00365875DD
HQVFIEVTPHPVLLGAMNDTLEEVAQAAGPGTAPGVVCGTLRRDDGGALRMATSLAEAFVNGVAVEWTSAMAQGNQVQLPTYAFQHKRYWPKGTLTQLAGRTGGGDAMSLGLGAVEHPLLGAVVELAGGAGLVCTGRLSVRTHPWLADHTVGGVVLLPGTGFVELAVRAGDQVGCGLLEELTLQAPLVVPSDGGVQVQVVVAAADTEGRREVQVFSRPDEGGAQQEWVQHAGGVVAPATAAGATEEDLLVWPPLDAAPVDLTDLYTVHLADVYGPSFHGLRVAWRRGDDVFAEVALPEEVSQDAGAFGLHPALLDAALHGAALVEADAGGEPGQVQMPFAWTGVELHAGGASMLRVRLRRDAQGGLSLTAADATGAPVVSVGSLVKRPVSMDQLCSGGSDLKDSLFVTEWAAVTGSAAPEPAGEWALIGADHFGLVDGLGAAGVQVQPFAGIAEVAAAIEAGEIDPRMVVVCAGDLPAEAGADTDADAYGGAAGAADAGDAPGAVRGVAGAALEMVQEWLEEQRLDAAQLMVVTRGAVDSVAGEAVSDLAAAAVWGLLRSAQSENPGRLVLADLPATDAGGHARVLPSALASGESELVIRGQSAYGRRLTRPSGELTRVEWPSVPKADATARSVLVTGGTGTLGALVARHLVATGRAGGVVLTSRSGPGAAEAAFLAAELATLGVWVQVVACDVADRDALAGVLAGIPAECPLGSVIHSAGVVDDGVIASLTPERLSAVMRPKVDAAWHLHELTAGLDLERFVTFSSAAATFGAPGQGNYVAANSYMDALAGYRRAAGLAGLSLQLGPWAHEEGIGRNLDERLLSRIDRGFVPLSAEAGLVVLDTALARDEAVLMPARLDIAALRAQAAGSAEIPPLWRTLAGVSARRAVAAGAVTGAPAGAGDALRRQLASVSAAERARILLDLVCAHVAAVLGHASAESVEASRAFTDVGFDSLTAVELRNRLNAETGLRLPATLVFDYPTPAALAALLRTEIAGEAGGLSAVAAPFAPVVAGMAHEPIAIVGMACRFPGGAASPDELWQLLDSGVDAIGPFPADRGWDLETLYPDSERGREAYTQAGGFVRDASAFDAGFFGISPREALAMDPQQRLLLETSWEAFERAGIDPATLRGSQTGAFIGGYSSRYGTDVELAGTDVAEGHMVTGNATSVLSGRLSYTFGLEGPAVTIDTACSSSLVALHMATQALRSGECSLALAGGATVTATPGVFVAFAKAGGISLDGRCKSFAASADGSGFAEGAGMLVVERLSDARRNGHRVLAVIPGSAINQDGASNGLTAPNGPSQQRVIRAALASARVSPADIDAVEAHGSATTLGDPIEAQALLATYGQERAEDRPLLLGSVKSNIGHTQAAAGVAGVMKMVLALQHERLPQTLHVEEPSPHVDWTTGDVRLLTESVPWPTGERVRRAGVSAFGMSGTNVHVILEEAPAEDAEKADSVEESAGGAGASAALAVLEAGDVTAWPVSARTAEGLVAQAGRLCEWVSVRPGLVPGDVAWSLAATRSVFEHRAVVVGGERGGLVGGVEGLVAGVPGVAGVAGVAGVSVVSGVARSGGRVVFVFAGQGSQWVGMG